MNTYDTLQMASRGEKNSKTHLMTSSSVSSQKRYLSYANRCSPLLLNFLKCEYNVKPLQNEVLFYMSRKQVIVVFCNNEYSRQSAKLNFQSVKISLNFFTKIYFCIKNCTMLCSLSFVFKNCNIF